MLVATHNLKSPIVDIDKGDELTVRYGTSKYLYTLVVNSIEVHSGVTRIMGFYNQEGLPQSSFMGTFSLNAFTILSIKKCL